jgi:hypothetical protein
VQLLALCALRNICFKAERVHVLTASFDLLFLNKFENPNSAGACLHCWRAIVTEAIEIE